MIRPITVVTFLVACGSGMYLYHTKHKVRVLDTEIEHVVHQTEHVREQTRILRAEWTLLDQPDRLQQLVAQFLTLQPTKPSQFVAMADLDSRLPAPLPPHVDTPAPAEPVPQPETPALVASAEPPAAVSPAPAPAAKSAPAPVRHEAPMVAEAATARPERPVIRAAARVVEPARPTASAIRAPVAAPPPPRPMPRYVAETTRPEPVYRPAYRPFYARPPAPIPVAAPAYGGSMLGMARAAAPPAPTPPAPTQWINWNR